ncbi:uncharacterized protein FA14DRAFT_118691 [Meira miltonrushii]|uniref:DNA polymeras-like protein subunit delta-2 n=1 Tax=Meira miltonrushii TaxID=1280837 RepID=A0A316VGD4_9BASI|nr:uncharacterized protein FA14DRAFT_118691 [Meira miltonrushii]PWN36697.1 hypothetical protein FA14DRAFT_118691 [Meira miltonrushii]
MVKTDTEESQAVQRSEAQYDALTDLAEPLLVPLASRKYNLQYSALYDYRLRRLKHPKGRLLAAATRRWTEGVYEEEESAVNEESQASTASTSSNSRSRKRGRREEPLPTAHYVKRILDVKQGKICFVIGTIYCSMHLKPDVLEELTREQWLPPQPPNERYADPERDEFFVEDESGRVRLVGDGLAPDGYLRSALVTGVVVAILGTETRSGDFEVADAIFAGVPPPNETNGNGTHKPAKTDFIGKTEGQNKQNGITSRENESMMGFAEAELRSMLLTDWLLGAVESDDKVEKVVGLVIAGNSIAPAPRNDDEKSLGPRNNQSGPPASKDAYPTSTFDDFLADLVSSMHVHLLPGSNDPTSIALPQQPLHFALLPKSSPSSGLHRETNPAWFGLAGKKFLGTSGQNIDDIFKYMLETDPESRLDAACNTLDWGHIAPTAPDTLACYPLNDRDPFLIEAAPDVYFVGNQDKFSTRLYHGTNGHKVRVILLPKFSTSGSIVLVNPKTLAVKHVNVGWPSLPHNVHEEELEG